MLNARGSSPREYRIPPALEGICVKSAEPTGRCGSLDPSSKLTRHGETWARRRARFLPEAG